MDEICFCGFYRYVNDGELVMFVRDSLAFTHGIKLISYNSNFFSFVSEL